MAGHTGLGRIVPDEKHGSERVEQAHQGVVTPAKMAVPERRMAGGQAYGGGVSLVAILVGAFLVVAVVVGVALVLTGKLSS